MVDTAPDRTASSGKIPAPTRDRKPRSSTGRKKSLAKPLEELFTTLGTVVYALNQVDGLAILNGAENLAKALNNVAKSNDVLYRNIERMLTGSQWGGVFVAVGAIAIPIAANHNLLPFAIPGLIPDIDNGNIESTPPIPDLNDVPRYNEQP